MRKPVMRHVVNKILFSFYQIYLWALVLLINAAWAQETTQARYDLKDLEILESERNYSEFFAHAKDIRPQNRNSYWRAMLANMAESYSSELLKQSIITKKDIHSINSLFEFTSLHSNEFFKKNRGKIGLKFFKKCYKNGIKERCSKDLIKFWQIDDQDSAIGIDLATLLKKNHNSNLNDLWKLVKPSTRGTIAKFNCQLKEVKEIVITKLLATTNLTVDPKTLPKKINTLISGECWSSVSSDVRKLLQDGNYSDKKLAFRLLSSKEKISEEDKDFYYTLFLITSPEKGEILNHSWNTLSELGQNYKRRQLVLNKLKRLDPLPDGLFATINIKKRDTILKHIHINMPEYLDFYARTCINYMAGRQTFKNGNPTVNCKKLFNATSGTDFVEPSLQKQFKNIVKI